MSKTKSIIHPASGIDITAPGGIESLLDFHRAHFGDAVMEENGGDGGNSGDNGAGSESGTNAQGNATNQGQTTEDTSGDEKLGEPGIKALHAERDARKQAEKDLEDTRARLQQLEDASKSDDQKQAERLQNLEQSDRQKDSKISSLEADLTRYRVAAAEGLDLEAAERLRGSTEDEIRADAKEFAKKFGTKRPGEVPGTGVRGSDAPNVTPGMGRLQSAYASTSK